MLPLLGGEQLMGNLMWWGVCAFLGLIGLGELSDSIAGGILILCGSIIAAPPVWQAIQSRARTGFHKTIVLILGIAGMVVGMQSPSFKAREAKQAEQKAKKAAATATSDASMTDAKPTSKYGDIGKQYSWIGAGKEAIKAKLKDPDSAKFRDVRFYSGGGIPVVCGQVNAKNGFGGYSGFEHFIAAGDTFAFLESEVSDGISKVWDKYCVSAPDDEAHVN